MKKSEADMNTVSEGKENTTQNLWGSETARALENFLGDHSNINSSDTRTNTVFAPIPHILIRAYAEVKLAALEGIQEVEQYFGENEMKALREISYSIITGKMNNAFPLPMAQGGAGTSFHMNICEVLANAVKERTGTELDSIEDLAHYQSTNDTFASAVIITAYRLTNEAERDTVILQEELVKKELEYDNLLMTGRTELQDALPMRVGSLFGAWTGSIERDRWRLSKVAERVREVPLGGTALGTGFGAPRAYTHAAERHLRRITSLPLSRSQNMMDGVALKDSLAELAGALRLTAVNISRMAADMLYYTSTPVGEFLHPHLQYGSSMMPLKVNPILLERARGLALSAIAEADKVDTYAREGLLQLNAYLPFLVRSLIACAEESRISRQDFLRFLRTMTPLPKRMEANLSRSPAILNALMPLVGYRAMKNLGHMIENEVPENLKTLAILVSNKTHIPLEDVEAALAPSRLTGPPRDL